VVQSQSGQIVRKTYLDKTHHKNQKRPGGVTEGIDPEFKPQYGKQNKIKQSQKKSLSSVFLSKQ
jgi:hypothetical protein